MNIIFFTNCQGEVLHKILSKSKAYCKNIKKYKWISNYAYNDNNIEDYISEISQCDIFVYQPLKQKKDSDIFYNTWNNDGVLKYLKPSCIKICFPCIYSDCFPLVENGSKFLGEEYILKLKDAGLSLDDILFLYFNKRLTFNLAERYRLSHDKLKENEKICHIKISDILIDFQKKYECFYTHNHPKEILLAMIANCILKICSFEDEIDIWNIECLYEATSIFPNDYSMKLIGFEYLKDVSPNNYYANNICKVFNSSK